MQENASTLLIASISKGGREGAHQHESEQDDLSTYALILESDLDGMAYEEPGWRGRTQKSFR